MTRCLAALLLCLLSVSALAQGTAVNPPVGSVWTYLGPTYGASWATTPFGSGPAPPGADDWLAKWAHGGGLVSAYSPLPAGNLVGSFHVSALGSWGQHNLHVGADGGVSAGIFSIDNTAAPATFALPGAVNGFARIPVGHQGNQVFGMYAVAELWASSGTVVAAEFTSRNHSGPGDTALPPNSAIGTSSHNAKGINLTCGQSGIGDCSVGIHIVNESGNPADPVFSTPLYIQFYRNFGMVIDPMPTGTQYSAIIRNNGNGIALSVSTSDPWQPDNGVIEVLTGGVGFHRWGVRQTGDMYTAGHIVAGPPQGRPSITSCGTGPSMTNGSDLAGVVTVGSGSPVSSCQINFARAYSWPVCVLTSEATMPTPILNLVATTHIVVAGFGGADMASKNFAYICMDSN